MQRFAFSAAGAGVLQGLAARLGLNGSGRRAFRSVPKSSFPILRPAHHAAMAAMRIRVTAEVVHNAAEDLALAIPRSGKFFCYGIL